MKRRFPRHAPILSAALLSALALTQCGKKDEPGSTDTPPEATAPAAATPFGDQAEKMGAAALLPEDTEFYLGTVQFKSHMEALKKSSWWKDISALIEDKTPATETENESLETLKELWGDDVFIAGGAGFSQSIGVLRDFNRLYNELNFRALMTGSTAGLGSAMPAANPLSFLMAALNEPATLERAHAFVEHLELFPLVVGIKTENAPEKLQKLITEETLKELEAKKITVADHQTPDGHGFKAATIEVGMFLTKEAQQSTLENLPPDLNEDSRKFIEKIFTSVRSKKMQVAWGTVGDYIVFASGKNLDHLKFAASPASSLLASPELAKLAPLAGKNLFSLLHINEESLLALHDDQPFLPMLRGVVSAMKANATFAEAGNVLSTQLDELTPLEIAAFGRKATDGSGAMWWDNGVHGEFFGGLQPVLFQSGKPLKYAGLLDQEKLLLGMTYHANPEFEVAVRAWVEKLFGVIYTGAKELIKAGIAGAEGQQQVAFFEMLILPTLQKVYQASKDINDKGLGDETVFLLDMNGTPPAMLSETVKGSSFPRLTTVTDVENRAEIAAGWNTIQDTINGVAAMLGGLGGAGAADGGAPPPSLIPEVDKIEKDGFTTWFYKTEMLDEDLTPNSTISDTQMILSSSRPAADAIAAFIRQPATETRDGLLWAVDFSVISDLIKAAKGNLPNQTPEQQAEAEQVIKWLKPFKRMEGHIHMQEGVAHQTFAWEIKDTVSFD